MHLGRDGYCILFFQKKNCDFFNQKNWDSFFPSVNSTNFQIFLEKFIKFFYITNGRQKKKKKKKNNPIHYLHHKQLEYEYFFH
jgi:hypothetical protein